MTSFADNIIDLYRRHATAWDRTRGKSLMERGWLDKFCKLLPAQGRVLDIGCGAGEPMAAYLIDQGYAVTGIDSAPEMIDLCRQRFPNHTWLTADMRSLSLGEAVDGLLAWDSFFHLTAADQRRMFPIFQEHAAPGAALMFTSGPAHGEAIGSFHDEPLYHASLAPDEYRSLLRAHGFDVVDHIIEDPACGGHTIWLARYR